MGIRDQILQSVKTDADTFKFEIIAIPEWDDAKVMVRELSAGDRRAYYSRARTIEEVSGGWKAFPKDDPLSDLYLVYLSTYEEDGSARTLNEDDIAALAQGGEKTEAAIGRIVEAAIRVSGLKTDDTESGQAEAGKGSATPTDEPPSSSATT